MALRFGSHNCGGFGTSCVEGALGDVEINLASLKDAGFVAEVQKRVAALSAGSL